MIAVIPFRIPVASIDDYSVTRDFKSVKFKSVYKVADLLES